MIDLRNKDNQALIYEILEDEMWLGLLNSRNDCNKLIEKYFQYNEDQKQEFNNQYKQVMQVNYDFINNLS